MTLNKTDSAGTYMEQSFPGKDHSDKHVPIVIPICRKLGRYYIDIKIKFDALYFYVT